MPGQRAWALCDKHSAQYYFVHSSTNYAIKRPVLEGGAETSRTSFPRQNPTPNATPRPGGGPASLKTPLEPMGDRTELTSRLGFPSRCCWTTWLGCPSGDLKSSDACSLDR